MNIKYFAENPKEIVYALGRKGVLNVIPDRLYLKMIFYLKLGYNLNLESPRTFNEKLQWLKLYDRNPSYIDFVDKIKVKEYVAKTIGNEFVVKTFGVWDTVDCIDFDSLPDRFVLKTNHDSGSVSICRNRNTYNIDEAKKFLKYRMRNSGFNYGREWPYKAVKPQLFAEEFIESNDDGDLPDYKLMSFGGKVMCVFTCTGRAKGDLRVDFFDTDWRHLPFTRHYPNADSPIPRPGKLDEMITLAEKLSGDIPFVRVDFYESGDRLLFGEMTFFPGAGFEEFQPVEWDERLGSWINLSSSYSFTGNNNE